MFSMVLTLEARRATWYISIMTEKQPTNAGENEQQPDWDEVTCWFGASCYPDSVRYRRCGERVQIYIEQSDEWVELTEPQEFAEYKEDLRYA
jgi:hypothetical protein